ncbi:hypothetical protein JTB14_011021 [Gonioctena quinquepunctata]|nr:hypothetical protein JTB14_011021 [Gonioctena quinquepunctata]
MFLDKFGKPKSDEDKESNELGINVSEKFDIGNIQKLHLTNSEIERVVKMGPPDHPAQFSVDIESRSFPTSLLKCKLPNDEYSTRDWIVWSFSKQALYCFLCRLFSNQPEMNRSNFARIFGYSKQLKWKKLYDRIPEHCSSNIRSTISSGGI